MKELLREQLAEFKKLQGQEQVIHLLNELRICQPMQLKEFFDLEYGITDRGIRKILSQLYKSEYVDYVSFGNNKQRNYFLTPKGNQLIGSFYAPANDPWYNLNHFVQIVNVMLEAIPIARSDQNFYLIETEQRLFWELRDQQNFEQQFSLNIPDFTFKFGSPGRPVYRHYFEIELTIKSRNRYYGEIFPWYSDQLEKYPDDHLIYVTPNEAILSKLKIIKQDILSRPGYDSLERLHIISQNNFKNVYQQLIHEEELY